jgi:hypothetical protein
MNMTNNTEILKKMISTSLHITAESRPMTFGEITATAVSLKNALHSLYPTTDKEWEEVMRDIGSYAYCLLY